MPRAEMAAVPRRRPPDRSGGASSQGTGLRLANKPAAAICHGAQLLAAAGLFANRNPIPFDHTDPDRTGGLRLGTSAITTRGMGTAEVDGIADWIDRLLQHPDDDAARQTVRAGVADLCRRFPLPS